MQTLSVITTKTIWNSWQATTAKRRCKRKEKSPEYFRIQGFQFWLLDLGSNQGPTD